MNPFAYLGAGDFFPQIQALFPRGRAWSRDPGSVQAGVAWALADTTAALRGRASALSEVESDPTQTDELLPDWETDFGLPDPCAGPNPTLAQRRSQLLARITAIGGQSAAYYTAFAQALGYQITIQTFTPRVFGSQFGAAFNGPAWAFAWQVSALQFTVDYRRFGSSEFGEPYAQWGNTVLICELQRVAPAHTVLLFSFTES
jgi:uncharacterized protein YmfQ (DUF2313 family)